MVFANALRHQKTTNPNPYIMKNSLKLVILAATLSLPQALPAQTTDPVVPRVSDTVADDNDDTGKWGLAGLLGLLGLLGMKRNDRDDRHTHTTNR